MCVGGEGGEAIFTSITVYATLLFSLESRTSIHIVQVASSVWSQPPKESAPFLSGTGGAHFTNVILVDRIQNEHAWAAASHTRGVPRCMKT